MLPLPLYVPGADRDKIERAKANRARRYPWWEKIRIDDFTCSKCDRMFVDEQCHAHRDWHDERAICHSCYVKVGGADLRG